MDEGRTTHHEPDLDAVADGLGARFGDVHSRDEILAAVRQAADEIAAQAKVPDFLELLIERRAREVLQARTAG